VSAQNLAVSPDRPEAAGSLRVSLARAALEAALHAPGVLGSDPGPGRLRVTADPPAAPLLGVSATAQADGRYAVDLSLVADMVPLPALADQVRERVRKRAQDERLEEVLGSIDVEFAYVATREEIAAAAAEREVEEALAAEKLASAAAGAEQTPQPKLAAASAEQTPQPTAPISAAAGVGEDTMNAQSGEPSVAEPSVAAGAGGDDTTLAVRQAALATDQAALAAKQAALAAEQAALVAGPEALPPHSRQRVPKEGE
jgi:hypothetical protein